MLNRGRGSNQDTSGLSGERVHVWRTVQRTEPSTRSRWWRGGPVIDSTSRDRTDGRRPRQPKGPVLIHTIHHDRPLHTRRYKDFKEAYKHRGDDPRTAETYRQMKAELGKVVVGRRFGSKRRAVPIHINALDGKIREAQAQGMEYALFPEKMVTLEDKYQQRRRRKKTAVAVLATTALLVGGDVAVHGIKALVDGGGHSAKLPDIQTPSKGVGTPLTVQTVPTTEKASTQTTIEPTIPAGEVSLVASPLHFEMTNKAGMRFEIVCDALMKESRLRGEGLESKLGNDTFGVIGRAQSQVGASFQPRGLATTTAYELGVLNLISNHEQAYSDPAYAPGENTGDPVYVPNACKEEEINKEGTYKI